MHWVNEHWVQLFINDQLHSMLIFSIEKTPSSRDHRSPLFLMHPLVLTPSVTIYHHGWTRLVIRSEKSLNEYKIPQMVQAQFWGPNIYFCNRSKMAKWFRLNSDSSIVLKSPEVSAWLLGRSCCSGASAAWFIFVNRKDDQRCRLKTNDLYSSTDLSIEKMIND